MSGTDPACLYRSKGQSEQPWHLEFVGLTKTRINTRPPRLSVLQSNMSSFPDTILSLAASGSSSHMIIKWGIGKPILNCEETVSYEEICKNVLRNN